VADETPKEEEVSTEKANEETKDEEPKEKSAGDKRDSEDVLGDKKEKKDEGESASDDDDDDDDSAKNKKKEEPAPPPPNKKARIAMPPAVASSLLEVDEYTLDEPTAAENTDAEDRIDTPSIILFGLHPLIREPPLKKMCEKYGQVKTIGVRSAFASRYGHVEYSSIEEARCAYKALNGAKLLHKAILVQPTKAGPAN
jgi:hypothetical protein